MAGDQRMADNKNFEADEHGNVPGPGKNPKDDDGARVRPGKAIGEKDRRVGRKIKQEEPSGDEPGYANHDNLPNP
jgi:hypothetical protein